MPSRVNVPCRHPGCPALIPYGQKYCEAHKPLHPEEVRSAAGRGYGRAWQKARKRYLEAQPLCVECMKEGKYVKETHAARFAKIRENWDAIVKIIDEEIPTAAEIEKILVTIGIEPTIAQLDLTSEDAKLTFQATKDIRDKYVLSRLAWDLGVMDEMCALL